MGLTFVKKAKETDTSKVPEEEAKPAATAATPTKPKTTSTGMNFMKQGADAKQAMDQAEAKAEAAKAESGKMFRFWIKPDEERKITFLDGDIGDEGMLDIPMFEEHRIRVSGDWKEFVCVGEFEPCPICENGDRAALIGVMTVIDHTPYTIKNGPNAGKIIQNSRKLFVPKRTTIKMLSKLAIKRGGLAGCTFDVSRSDEKSPNVGNQFDFVEKQSLSEVATKYGLDAEGVTPATYGEEFTYRTAEELLKLGVGKVIAGGVGNEVGVNTKALADEL